ncbi:MAG: preprotein translocase subunit SecA [Desulfobulbus propionicus]|nr:MAG: preprotein translocase subunit SecA [Desulfobulbus propionicus]
MGTIGRNDPCPCGSGKKFKHCCLHSEESSSAWPKEQDIRQRLADLVERIQQTAGKKEQVFFELGVLLFFSTKEGDAWLLEVTDADCVQIARQGKAIDCVIKETSEKNIEINWTHTFSFREKRVYVTPYDEQSLAMMLDTGLSGQIHAAIRRIKKRASSELLEKVHIL